MKKIIFLSFIVILIFSPCLTPTVLALENPEHQAFSSLLADRNTGQIIYSYNADTRVYPASTTKVMTVLLVMEAIEAGDIGLNDKVTATETALHDITEDASSADIQLGETLSVENLLYLTMVISANDACNMLAEYVGGSIEDFVASMNTRAWELGCTGTNFVNTNGLPDDNHYTTAMDLYRITQEALKSTLFVTLSNTVAKTIPATNLSGIREIETTNKLIDPNSIYYYERASGVKTGYTKAAGNCLISTAQSGDISLIAIVMGVNAGVDYTGVDYNVGTSMPTNFSETITLYNWAFENFNYQQVLGAGETVATVPVILGKDSDSVDLTAKDPIYFLLPNNYSDADILRNILIYHEQNNEDLSAPVRKGDNLGEITLTYNNSTFGPVKLVANKDVSRSFFKYLFHEASAILNNPLGMLMIVGLVLLIVLYVTYMIKQRHNRRKNRK